MGGDTFFAARKPQPFRGRRLDRDAIGGKAERPGNGRTHGRDVRRQFRLLCNDGRVDIRYSITCIPYHVNDLFKQKYAGDVAVLFIGIRKMLPDITQGGGTQHGITDGMQQHIGIRMTKQAAIVRNRYAADDARATLCKSMYIVSVSYTYIRHGVQ